jgi:hypothetical protein
MTAPTHYGRHSALVKASAQGATTCDHDMGPGDSGPPCMRERGHSGLHDEAKEGPARRVLRRLVGAMVSARMRFGKGAAGDELCDAFNAAEAVLAGGQPAPAERVVVGYRVRWTEKNGDEHTHDYRIRHNWTRLDCKSAAYEHAGNLIRRIGVKDASVLRLTRPAPGARK